MHKTWHWGAFLPVLLLATFLRFHLLEAQSFWNDEGNSARLSERSVQLIIEGTASDIHPPLYYLLLRGWRELVGETEFGLRSLSAFAGVLTVAVTVGWGRNLMQGSGGAGERGSRGAGAERGPGLYVVLLVTAVLVSINPALIYYSQEARMYALLGLLAMVASWLLVVWRQRPSWSIAAAYVVVAAAGLYTHYFFPTVLVAHNAVVLIWVLQKRGKAVGSNVFMQSQTSTQLPRPYKKSPAPPLPRSPAPLLILKRWSIIMLATLLLYAPWLPIFAVQFSSEPVQRPPLLPFLRDVWRWLLFGATIAETAVSTIAVVLLLLLGVGVVNGRWRVLLPLFTIIGPLGFMYITGTTGPAFFKFLVIAIPAVMLIFSLALTGGWEENWGRFVLVGLLLLTLPGTVQSIRNMYHDPRYARADYRAMAARVTAESHPDAGIILEAANQWEVFTYYFADETVVYPLPKGRSRPQPAVIDETLTAIAGRHDRLYALFWGEAQRDPERLVERWLESHAFKAADEWVGDVRFVTYAVPSAAATEMETAVSIPFGTSIQLNGFTLRDDDLRAGDIVQLTLFWQTSQPLESRYKVFLHLLDENGHLVAQRDSEPGGGLALTTTWAPEQVVSDNHGVLLPINLPSGEYRLQVGLYDIADAGERLPVVTETAVSDAWEVGIISVR